MPKHVSKYSLRCKRKRGRGNNSFAVLTRPNKAKTASMAANILSLIFVVVVG